MGTEMPGYSFYELRHDIPWDYQIRYLKMWQIVHALANIDKVDLSDDTILHELVKLTLAAKRVDAETPQPRTKADGTDQGTAAV